MINLDSLTIEKVIIDQPMSRIEVFMFTLISILILIAFLTLPADSNPDSDLTSDLNSSKSKTFNGDILLAIMIITFLMLTSSYFRTMGSTGTEFYKINIKIDDPKITPELLDKTKDRGKLNIDSFEGAIFKQFKTDSSELYFKDNKLYANIYMYVSNYNNIRNISEFKNIVSEYINYELELRKNYKSPEDIEKEERQMEDYLEERLVGNGGQPTD